MKRTLRNCSVIKKAGCEPHQYDGVCEGFQRSEDDDEPCQTCMNCSLHYLNAQEQEERNGKAD